MIAIHRGYVRVPIDAVSGVGRAYGIRTVLERIRADIKPEVIASVEYGAGDGGRRSLTAAAYAKIGSPLEGDCVSIFKAVARAYNVAKPVIFSVPCGTGDAMWRAFAKFDEAGFFRGDATAADQDSAENIAAFCALLRILDECPADLRCAVSGVIRSFAAEYENRWDGPPRFAVYDHNGRAHATVLIGYVIASGFGDDMFLAIEECSREALGLLERMYGDVTVPPLNYQQWAAMFGGARLRQAVRKHYRFGAAVTGVALSHFDDECGSANQVVVENGRYVVYHFVGHDAIPTHAWE
jgi:hypothetical protein